jgi:hypothetical protein
MMSKFSAHQTPIKSRNSKNRKIARLKKKNKKDKEKTRKPQNTKKKCTKNKTHFFIIFYFSCNKYNPLLSSNQTPI